MISALFFGFLSSLHCMGMCGPIAMMLPIHGLNASQKAIRIMLYHLGRITSYVILGVLFGWLGRGFFLAGFQQKFSIFIGIAMIVYVLIPKNKAQQFSFLKPINNVLNHIKKQLGIHLKKTNILSFYIIGFFNGWLPCAMIYVALFGALATQDVFRGAIYMALFGLGTIPLMSAVVYFSQFITATTRNKILKIVPFFIIVLGVLFILRGLNLDIPFLSPSTLQLFVSSNPDCF